MQRLLVYSPETGLVKSPSVKETSSYLKAGSIIWLDIQEPQPADYDLVGKLFQAHPLVFEEIKVGHGLPKIISFPDSSFLIWQVFSYDDTGKFDLPRLFFLISSNYIVTLHDKEIPAVSEVLVAAEKENTLFRQGTGMICYTILDGLVDQYFLLLDGLSDQLDLLEDKMFGEPTQADVKKLFSLKRDMLVLRKVAAPEREVINAILRRDLPYFPPAAMTYYEDLYDHLVRIIDLVDTFRDVMSGAMQIYLANVSNKLNTIMKTLTIVATIMMPATLIASFFGMNFALITEGVGRSMFWFAGSLMAMVLIAVAMLYWAWLKKWL